MGRWARTGNINVGSLPSQAIRVDLNFTTLGNPAGDWGQAYMLAHPENPDAELVCDYHSKVFKNGVYHYLISVNNRGPNPTAWDVDW